MESWKAFLLSLRDCGVHAAKLAVGDGALGLGSALADVYPMKDQPGSRLNQITHTPVLTVARQVTAFSDSTKGIKRKGGRLDPHHPSKVASNLRRNLTKSTRYRNSGVEP